MIDTVVDLTADCAACADALSYILLTTSSFNNSDSFMTNPSSVLIIRYVSVHLTFKILEGLCIETPYVLCYQFRCSKNHLIVLTKHIIRFFSKSVVSKLFTLKHSEMTIICLVYSI